jgi:hypothetical protein
MGTQMKPKLLMAARNYLDFALVEDYPLRFSKAKGRRIECLTGTVWITAYDELPDYMLKPGEVFVIPNNGKCVVEAIAYCQVRIDLPSLSWHVILRIFAYCERHLLIPVWRSLRDLRYACSRLIRKASNALE